MTDITPTSRQIQELAPKEAREFFDRQARRYLNMSGEEVLRWWDAGEIDEPDRTDMLRVAMLIPFVKPQ